MLILGLTGSIATGKSTVSALLASPAYNLPVVDADVLARRVVEPGTPGYARIVEYFGPTTPDLLQPATESGGNGPVYRGRPLNRPALGRRVFGNEPDRVRDRKVLNGIVHPAVRKEMFKLMLYYYLTGHWAVVLDIPLLFESGWERLCGTIMVVAVSDPEVQIRRLRQRDPHLTEEDARNRVRSQWDVRDKAERTLARGKSAGVVVWNDGDKKELEHQVSRAMAEVKIRSPQWWAWLLLAMPPLAGLSALYSFCKSLIVQKRLAAS